MAGHQKQSNYLWAGVIVIVASLAFSRGGTQSSQPSSPPVSTPYAATTYAAPVTDPSPISSVNAETPTVRDLAAETREVDASRLTSTQSVPYAPPATSAVDDHQVWVNTNSGVYHFPGQRWYGNTKEGMFMSQKDADAAGYRPTRNGQ